MFNINDRVFVYRDDNDLEPRVETVYKVHQKYVILMDGSRFSHGGGEWEAPGSQRRIVPVSPENFSEAIGRAIVWLSSLVSKPADAMTAGDWMQAICRAQRVSDRSTLALYMVAALQSFGAESARAERERVRSWEPSPEKPADWETEYTVVITGKTLEAMRFLAWFVLNSDRPSLSAIGASDHLHYFAREVREVQAFD